MVFPSLQQCRFASGLQRRLIKEPPVSLQALMFVRDLDTSLLGQNEHGLEQFDTLRKCTDELVNAILHVRQLLKRRRFEGECATFCVHICPMLFCWSYLQ